MLLEEMDTRAGFNLGYFITELGAAHREGGQHCQSPAGSWKRSLMVAELLSEPKYQSPPVPAPVPSFSSAS